MPSEKERALEIVQETENEILRRCRSPESANRIFSPDDLRAAAILRAQAEALSGRGHDEGYCPQSDVGRSDACTCSLTEDIAALRAAAAELEAE